jgi:hypothetical protein
MAMQDRHDLERIGDESRRCGMAKRIHEERAARPALSVGWPGEIAVKMLRRRSMHFGLDMQRGDAQGGFGDRRRFRSVLAS